MKFQALGGAREVGASSYLIELDGKNILFDAGMRLSPRPGQSPIPKLDFVKKLDLIVLTHAHLDHIGSLPIIMREFRDVWVLCTEGTFDLAKVLLSNNLHVVQERALRIEQAKSLLYTEEELTRLPERVFLCQFGKWFKPFPDRKLEMCFHPSGHILGASSILIKAEEGNVMLSGDFSIAPQYTVQGAAPTSFKPDVLIMEATYGGETHPSREDEEASILEEIREVISNQEVALIPSFAVGRAQEMALMILKFQREKKLPQFPIYLDGLVQWVCRIYEEHLGSLFSQEKSIRWPTRTTRKFDLKGPACIVSSSGNLKGGYSSEYAKYIIGRPDAGIFFPGYQDAESPGRRLLELKRGGILSLGRRLYTVNCAVRRYKFSGHADAKGLLQFAQKFNPRIVILIHSEFKALRALSRELKCRIVWQPRNLFSFDPFEANLNGVQKKQVQDNRRSKG